MSKKSIEENKEASEEIKESRETVSESDTEGSSSAEQSAEGEKKDGKMRKTRRTKACFNCGKPVAPEDHECPHCKATGESSKVNSGLYLRIALGFFLGLILWAIFYR